MTIAIPLPAAMRETLDCILPITTTGFHSGAQMTYKTTRRFAMAILSPTAPSCYEKLTVQPIVNADVLTYMSVTIQLQALSSSKDLIFRAPSLVSKGAARDLFVSQSVDDFLEFRGVAADYERASGRALAKVDGYAAGNKIVFSLNPHRKSPATLVARNAPVQHGVVDLRVCSTKPDVRLFGCFAAKDVLVLLTWAPKTGLHYGTEIARCRAEWDRLFPEHTPLIGSHHDDYLSNIIPG